MKIDAQELQDETGARQPARRFDVTVAAPYSKEYVPDDETEDVELTDYVTRAWLELINPLPTPLPLCPHCGGARIRANGNPVNNFFCHYCHRHFNRMTGTPFARLRDRDKGTAIIPLLSRQMSVLQARSRLKCAEKGLLSWLLAFRRFLLELDPQGHWEARVRLGVQVAPRVRCSRCCFEGGFRSAGFDPLGRRRVRCPQCEQSYFLDALQREGQGLEAEVRHDVADAAIRQRRKYHPKMAGQTSRGMPTWRKSRSRGNRGGCPPCELSSCPCDTQSPDLATGRRILA